MLLKLFGPIYSAPGVEGSKTPNIHSELPFHRGVDLQVNKHKQGMRQLKIQWQTTRHTGSRHFISNFLPKKRCF